MKAISERKEKSIILLQMRGPRFSKFLHTSLEKFRGNWEKNRISGAQKYSRGRRPTILFFCPGVWVRRPGRGAAEKEEAGGKKETLFAEWGAEENQTNRSFASEVGPKRGLTGLHLRGVT